MSNPTTQDTAAVGYGLIGAGAFGRYCLGRYASLDGVKRVAVADASDTLARQAAEAYGLEVCGVDELLARDDVELVHLATPPGTHKDLALRAIAAGKHVLCEKPLAVTVDDGRAMVDAAKARGVNLAANLIMRHVPHCERVKAVLDTGLLGEPIHGEFINGAKDQELGPDHWFWDPAKSGGIFIEHGVHFFDVFDWWLGTSDTNPRRPANRRGGVPTPEHGTPTLLHAHAGRRPRNPRIVERVLATVRYGDPAAGVDVTFFHGFTQANVLDRQQWRIVCERGEIRMSQWVPDTLTVEGLMDEPGAAAIAHAMGGAAIQCVLPLPGDAGRLTARHKPVAVDGRYTLDATDPRRKDELYGVALRDLLADQARALREPDHPRRLNESHAMRSLELADAATRAAEAGGIAPTPPRS